MAQRQATEAQSAEAQIAEAIMKAELIAAAQVAQAAETAKAIQEMNARKQAEAQSVAQRQARRRRYDSESESESEPEQSTKPSQYYDAEAERNSHEYFSNTYELEPYCNIKQASSLLEPFWNNAHTQTQYVKNKSNILPIGIYSSNNIFTYDTV